MKILPLLIFIFFTEHTASQDLFRGENLLVKPPSSEVYKAYYKEKGGLKSTTWASIESSTKDTLQLIFYQEVIATLIVLEAFKTNRARKLARNLIQKI